MTGLYLVVSMALPSSVVMIYFNLRGDWHWAFVSGAVFIGCGLILTTVGGVYSRRRFHTFTQADALLFDVYTGGELQLPQ
jgi:hypothetical protein